MSQIDRLNNVDLQWDTQYDMTGDGQITVRQIDLDEFGNPMLNTNPDLWIQTPSDYGEKYCYEELDDLWQYFPTSCPKDCSRHGSCLYNFCVCDEGYTGIDCSNVSCPDDLCIFDYLGHTQVCEQCNNRGTCNGYTGQCDCEFPASGESCREYDCLNDCNGNGCAITVATTPSVMAFASVSRSMGDQRIRVWTAPSLCVHTIRRTRRI